MGSIQPSKSQIKKEAENVEKSGKRARRQPTHQKHSWVGCFEQDWSYC